MIYTYIYGYFIPRLSFQLMAIILIVEGIKIENVIYVIIATILWVTADLYRIYFENKEKKTNVPTTKP